MKKSIMFVIVLMFSTVFAIKKDAGYRNARQDGAEAKLKLLVSDDEGLAVSNASVCVFMGMNFRPKGYWLQGKTDEDGSFVIQGKTCGDEVDIHVSKVGFYSSRRKLSFAEMGAEHDVKDGRWQPYDSTESIHLRKIRHPKTLIKSGFGMGRDVPVTNSWIGVDMSCGDFVKPYGKGKMADFEMRVEWDGHPPVDSNYCVASMRFVDGLSGGYFVQKVHESEYPYVYSANTNGVYAIHQFQIVGRNAAQKTNLPPFGKDSVLVTRTRCVLDEEGRLQSACYGYIRIFEVDAGWGEKPTMRFSSVFNGKPNDTNLEAK